MKTSELTRLLKQSGCRLIRHGSRHDIWWSPVTNQEFLIWRHPSREIPTGTVNKILKDAGIKERS